MKNAEKEIHRIRIALERNEKQWVVMVDKLSTLPHY